MAEPVRKCRRCGREVPAGELSKRGLCPSCVLESVQEAVRQLREHRGPVYEKWRKAWEAANERRITSIIEYKKLHRGEKPLPELWEVRREREERHAAQAE